MPNKDKHRTHIRPVRPRAITRRRSLVPSTGAASDRKAQNAWTELEIPDIIFALNPHTEPTVFDTEALSHNAVMTSVVNSGDGLVTILALHERNADGVMPQITTLPTNWVRLRADVVLGLYTVFFFGKIAAGTEAATLVNFVTDIDSKGVAITQRWTNWRNSGVMTNDIEIQAATGSNVNPNPPANNPVNWDLENTSWVAGFALPEFYSVTAIPANYINHLRVTTTSAPVPRIQLNVAHRQLATASEDPGTFTTAGSHFWCAFTIAVRPATTSNPRKVNVPHAEMEVPPSANRQSRVYWAEGEFPDVDRIVRVFHAEMETPSNDRHARVPHVELEAPDVEKEAQVSYSELEVPDIIVSPTEKFTLLVELEIAMEISLINQPTLPWTLSASNFWVYNLGTRNVIDEDRKQITAVTMGEGKVMTAANNASHCQATDASWFNLVSTNELFVNPVGAINPNTRITLAWFKVYYSNYAVHYNGQFYEPRVQLDANDLNLRISANDETLQGAPTIEGQIKLFNGDGAIDYLTANYVVIGGRVELKTLSGGVATPISSNIVGEIVRTDSVTALRLWN